MVLNTNVEYLETWKITSTNYQFIEVVDLKSMRSYVFQGDESNEISEKLDELGVNEFLDWFYLMELDLSCDHPNYEFTEGDVQYIVENSSYFNSIKLKITA
ncbi:MAG: hypothetical protein ACTSP9_03145 [Promethearchaeota archaeon]